MAKTKTDKDLFDLARARGLRKRTARALAEAPDKVRNGGSAPKAARRALKDLRGLVAEAEDRISGGPAKRAAAAKKGAATRRRKAAARSEAAKKGARSRARS